MLLIDDSPFFRNMLTPVLQAAGYQVTAVASASEALALLKDGRSFDVAITDVDMPEMDGFQFAEAVRADPRTAELPVIALCSTASPEAIERGRSVGFHDFVAKFDRQGLIAALKEQAQEPPTPAARREQHMTEETNEIEFITATVGSQLFGLPILRVQDVFAPERITRVPLAAPEIAGVLNLRGRIVTLIDLRRRLGLGAARGGRAGHGDRRRIARRILRPADRQRRRGAQASDEAGREPNPLNLDPKLAAVSAGIYRLETQLLVIVDVDRVLDIGAMPVAA